MILSSCAVAQGFFILTFSVILVQSKKVTSYPNFLQSVKIVFALPNKLNRFYVCTMFLYEVIYVNIMIKIITYCIQVDESMLILI